MMMKTYKYRLYPTTKERELFDTTLWLCRNLYNSALEQRITAYSKHGVGLSYYTQKRELPTLKKEMSEYKGVHSQVLQDVLQRLDNSYQHFFRRVKSGVAKAGFPRFQGKNRYNSFTYPQSGFKIIGTTLRLSKIGDIRIHLHQQMQGVVKTCSIVKKNDKYYACFTCDVGTFAHRTGRQVGVDLGIAHLAITSDGVFYDNPKYQKRTERQIKKLQRTVSRRKKGSNRRRKAVALLSKKHEQIANQRKDNNHKISRSLVDQYDLIAFEDLDVLNMTQNKRFAKAIADAGWRQLVDFTTYKAEYADKNVKRVNPYNTSQTCSNCGTIVKKKLSVRLHVCSCGYTEHRDINAAHNILALGLQAS